jgi:hypothetical protein
MGSVSQAVGIMHERVRPKADEFFQTDDTLYAHFEERTDDDITSFRPYRVPMILLGAAQFQQSNIDGGGLGTGIAPTTDAGTIVPIVFSQAHQYTKLTELTTKNDEQAIENFVTLTMKLAMEQFRERLDAVVAVSDNSNTLDTVVAVAGALITVNNATLFADGQKIDVWSALGGIFRGTATIFSTDNLNKQLNLIAAAPAGTVAGDLLLVRGSAGTAGTGLNGIKAFQVSSTVGSVMGIPRTSYPGKLSTPNVNLNNQPLTPASARLSIAKLQRALGIKAPKEKKLLFWMGVDMIAAWENVGIVITQNIYQQQKGNESEDMLKSEYPGTFAGRPTLIGLHAAPGRIDGLCLKHWFRAEFKKIDYYDVAGQTLFPQYAPDGGLLTNMMFYLYIGVQVGMENVLAGTFINNIPVPSGY